MKLRLVPLQTTEKSVISYLFLNDKFQCYILEPPNPIPTGTYEIKLEPSVKFQRIMPVLQNVPGHTAIEIHWGNTASDTKDCLLTGKMYGADFVGDSIAAFNELFPLLQASATAITIEVVRTPLQQQPPKGDVKMPDVPAPVVAPVPVSIPTDTALGAFEIHPKVAVYTIVIVLVNTLIATAKLHGWFDVTADTSTLGPALGALAAYFTKGS